MASRTHGRRRVARIVSVLVAGLLVASGCGDLAVEQNASGETTPSAPTVATAVAEPTTVPVPDDTLPATAEDPLRVMVIGDSVTYEIAPALEAALESGGQAQVEDRTQVGLGLSRWPIFPWLEVWYPSVEELRPDVVVVQTGIWDVVPDVMGADMRVPSPTDPDWEEEYGYLMDRLVALVTRYGAHVYWATMLPLEEDQEQSDRLNQRVEDLVARDDRVELVDLDPAFRFLDGSYAGSVVVDDIRVPLRKVDGVHLCRDGAASAAALVAAAIAADWDVAVSEDWVEGPWRRNPRYDVNPCPAPSLAATDAGNP